MTIFFVTTAETVYERHMVYAKNESEARAKFLHGEFEASWPDGDGDDQEIIDIREYFDR